MNHEKEHQAKLEIADKIGFGCGCLGLTVSAAVWLGIISPVVLALLKFVFG